MKLLLYNLYQLILTIYRVIRYSRKATITKFTIDKEECYILGNGPSLKNDIDEIGVSENIIAVNKFVISSEYEKYKPSFYVLADPVFWSDKIEREDLIKLRDVVFQGLIEKTTWNINVLIPTQSFKYTVIKNVFEVNNNINVLTYNETVATGFDGFKHYIYKIGLGMPHSQNVLVASIYCAIILGFKTINVLGADHSWHEEIFVNNQNEVCLRDKHFYDKSGVKSGKPWRKGNEEIFSMSELFDVLSKMFKGYEELESFSKSQGINILNLSSKSYVDAFKRRKL